LPTYLNNTERKHVNKKARDSFKDWIVSNMILIGVILGGGSAIQLLFFLVGSYEPSGWIYVIASTAPIILILVVGIIGKILFVAVDAWDSPSSLNRTTSRLILTTATAATLLFVIKGCATSGFGNSACRYDPDICAEQ
jgi:hypothetical protein